MIGETLDASELPPGLVSAIPALVPRPLGAFAPLEITIVRELTDEDILDALAGVELLPAPTIRAIRHSHHRIAMLLCEGKSPAAVSLVTGYSPGYVSRLQHDPMFRELLDYYSVQVESTHVDTLERMKVLNLTAMDELQQRLEADPEAWTKKDLMDLAKLTTPLGANVGQASAAGTPAPSGVALTIKFVTPETSVFSLDEAKVINQQGQEIPPEQRI